MHDCVQIHGGIGVTFEHDLHLFLRRVTVDRSHVRNRRPNTGSASPRRSSRGSGSVTTTDITLDDVEDLEASAHRARDLDPRQPRAAAPASGGFGEMTDEQELAEFARRRAACSACCSTPASRASCVPKEYGGAGLTPAHAKVFSEEIAGFDYPTDAPCPQLHAVHGGDPRVRHARAEAAAHPADPERRARLRAVPVRAEQRVRRRRRPHHGRPRRRRVGAQRLEDLELRRVACRLRAVPGPHELGRREAPRSDACSCVPVARSPASSFTASRCSAAPRSSARSSSPTCASPTPTASATSTTAGRSASVGLPRAQLRDVAAPHPPGRRRRGRHHAGGRTHPAGPPGRATRRPGRSRHDRRGAEPTRWSRAPR